MTGLDDGPSVKPPTGGKINGHHIFDLGDLLEYGPLSLRLGYLSTKFDFNSPDLNTLFAGFTQFGEAVSAIPALQSAGAQA